MVVSSDEHMAGHDIIISPPEQWPCESMHKLHEMHNQKCLYTNNDMNLALLQIISMPIDTGLPSPATLLFNRPIIGLLPKMNREPIDINNDDA